MGVTGGMRENLPSLKLPISERAAVAHTSADVAIHRHNGNLGCRER